MKYSILLVNNLLIHVAPLFACVIPLQLKRRFIDPKEVRVPMVDSSGCCFSWDRPQYPPWYEESSIRGRDAGSDIPFIELPSN